MRSPAGLTGRVTIADVARQAGVSTATVSHVINNTRFVSDETRHKVNDAIEALGYAPSAVARSLVTNVSQIVGVVVSDVTNPFFPAIVRGIEENTLAARYNMLLGNTDEDPAREEDIVRLMMRQRVDGLIIAPTGVHCPPLLALAQSGVPIVQIDRTSPGLAAPCVGVDNEEGAYQAVSHLIGLGHRRIACLLGIETISTQVERLNGWKRALREACLPVDESLIVRADPRFYGTLPDDAGAIAPMRPAPERELLPSVDDVLQDLLAGLRPPTAVFALTNQLALGTLFALKARGLRFPEDISLVSFDDPDWAPLFSPPLTTVRQPAYQLGQAASDLLLHLINREPAETPPPLRVALMRRASSGPPPE
ncbi:MAG: LacI family DNA-binding transcriptional regulator [Nitrososphaerales archaeon]